MKQVFHHNGDVAARRPTYFAQSPVAALRISCVTKSALLPVFAYLNHFFQNGDFLTFSRLERLKGTWSQGYAISIVHPSVPISSPLTHMVYLLPIFELFSCFQNRFCLMSARPTQVHYELLLSKLSLSQAAIY